MNLNYCKPLLPEVPQSELVIIADHEGQAGSGAFSYAELRIAFWWILPMAGMVDWKDQILFTVSQMKLDADGITPDLIAASIAYFTGSVAKITPDNYAASLGHKQLTVRASGYYAAVGS